jgi:hypothetical protein
VLSIKFVCISTHVLHSTCESRQATEHTDWSSAATCLYVYFERNSKLSTADGSAFIRLQRYGDLAGRKKREGGCRV